MYFQLLFLFHLRPCAQIILQHILPVVRVELQNHKLTVVDIAKVFEVFNAPVVPLHQEYPGHETMGDQYAHASEIILPK